MFEFWDVCTHKNLVPSMLFICICDSNHWLTNLALKENKLFEMLQANQNGKSKEPFAGLKPGWYDSGHRTNANKRSWE